MGIVGIGLVLVSFLVVFSIPNFDPTIQNDPFLPDLLDSMFDEVSPQVQIFSGESSSFSFSTSKSEVPLLWSIQVSDFQSGDEYSVTISNIFGDELGSIQNDSAFFIDMFVIPKNDIYNFVVENLGERPISVTMMFSEDPDNSDALTDPNSPVMSTLVPLAISGILLVSGIVVVLIGIIITILDWKKGQNKSRYL